MTRRPTRYAEPLRSSPTSRKPIATCRPCCASRARSTRQSHQVMQRCAPDRIAPRFMSITASCSAIREVRGGSRRVYSCACDRSWSATAYFNLGHALREQGKRAEAAAAYRQVIRIMPQLCGGLFVPRRACSTRKAVSTRRWRRAKARSGSSRTLPKPITILAIAFGAQKNLAMQRRFTARRLRSGPTMPKLIRSRNCAAGVRQT